MCISNPIADWSEGKHAEAECVVRTTFSVTDFIARHEVAGDVAMDEGRERQLEGVDHSHKIECFCNATNGLASSSVLLHFEHVSDSCVGIRV
jgi:hypothetical protein